MKPPDFYLASSEGFGLEQPRACWRVKRLTADSGADLLLVRVDPPVEPEPLGLKCPRLNRVILAPRWQGHSLFPINRFPLFVYVLAPVPRDADRSKMIRAADLRNVAWAELYATEAAAAAASGGIQIGGDWPALAPPYPAAEADEGRYRNFLHRGEAVGVQIESSDPGMARWLVVEMAPAGAAPTFTGFDPEDREDLEVMRGVEAIHRDAANGYWVTLLDVPLTVHNCRGYGLGDGSRLLGREVLPDLARVDEFLRRHGLDISKLRRGREIGVPDYRVR